MLGLQLGIHLSGSLSVHKGKCSSLKTRVKTTQPLLFVGGPFDFFSCNIPLLEKLGARALKNLSWRRFSDNLAVVLGKLGSFQGFQIHLYGSKV